MLYVTTREKHDAFTATKALTEDRGPNGGLYLPMNLPHFDKAQLTALTTQSFGDCVAQILNQFFSCRLTGWDVEQCAGRHPVRCLTVGPRTIVAEAFRNIRWDYAHLEEALSLLVCHRMDVPFGTTSWFRIAARIAVVFALYGEAVKTGALDTRQTFDVSVPTGDFTAPMAFWYAREMGLPVANIICACNDNGAVWDLIHTGHLRTDVPTARTTTPLADFAVPAELERLIFGKLGIDEAMRFGHLALEGGQYTLASFAMDILRNGMFAAVVSSDRVAALVPSAYSTCRYVMGPYTVLAYGALMDYRSRTGERRPALILADRSPVCDSTFVAKALNISAFELKQRIETP